MPITPSSKMKNLAARRLIDTIRLATITMSDDVDPVTLAHTETETGVWQGSGLVHRQQTGWIPGEGRQFGLRELNIWVADDAAPEAGQRCTIVAAGDASLVGKTGTVIEVQRATQRAVRRITVRMGDDT